ncbi:MAG TPA: 2-C-methyl-D-erythritol 2,4-cyclodiphosphate synthase [Syntrophomonadaceae bacterium]|nr:2-C-methyl-D-erythritol 2,4-cyclodiphosphate synthase [Syntrophomonadaceae bacterium]HNX28100.1 2-C-methyl-D-erythritol 2,4-cyclodiphosphate synthase [Syntrophomonadaceae bacterium]HPR93497.1 2-C-methyl-D-erythritol 2,4-cyclodiphosphate synthase [Syntrophomonadaceae bacterium]
MRIGTGYDVHQLQEGRKLILGGVDIPYVTGLLGHSDADVLVHAVCDALLGAAALGDIGRHFPDNDPRYKDIDSLKLLKDVRHKISESGYKISNLDCTIIAEKPKLSPFIPQMCDNIAQVLELDLKQVNIKATTTEKLGFTGREEGIAAQAAVLLMEL